MSSTATGDGEPVRVPSRHGQAPYTVEVLDQDGTVLSHTTMTSRAQARQHAASLIGIKGGPHPRQHPSNVSPTRKNDLMSSTAAPSAIATTDDYAAAVEAATTAAAAYYADGTSTMDDDVYDALVRAIADWEAAHPDQVLPDSPTGKVAGGAATGDVPHTRPMLSLDNVFGDDQLRAWAASLERRLDRPVEAWAVETKLDGLAIAARYHRGRLAQLITRGNGTEGEDVTANALGHIVGLPTTLERPETLEIRGEVLLTRDQYEAANSARVAAGGDPFTNPRAAAAGAIRTKTRTFAVEWTFFGYSALPLQGTSEPLAAELTALPHSGILELLAELGVQTSSAALAGPVRYDTLDGVLARVKQIADARAGLEFGIDGIVVKADAALDQEQAGFSSRAPRWAIAYKLPADTKITKLVDVEWEVGRTGIIAPRAVLDPVAIGGVTITYATLHNASDIARKDLMIGDQVTVFRAGDVIPAIEAPLVAVRTGAEQPIAIPQVCPRCGSDIDRSQERWRCTLGRACNALASIEYAVSRDALDIEGMGRTRIVQLVDAGLIADFADLFTLTREQILSLERMGQTSTDNLLNAIEVAKRQPLARVLTALGIRGTGRSMSRRMARHFATMDHLRAADAEAIQQVDGLGPEKAPVIVDELAELAPLIDKLVAAGVNMVEPGATPPGATTATDTELPLAGKSVVVTGSMTGPLEALSRNEMNELIERAGGKSSSSVSKKTALVVAGDKAGSKLAKAESLGIPVIGPEEFAELVATFL
ncbi:NAD-dependent DNA ligase LigA [Actinomadura kijaniata]|uniref:NAD-dependent DNA ligase LigA n=1 Tax=Actinomadura kijaniata TaxID=46161 RepID=UPI001FDFEA2A|nr:NAD-dependent DNA ligase LigA [Actinomadura kijaniata]